ncbi:MAG: DUF2339 domain-containing protein [Pyrinomonadaceae bacterium]
MVDEENEGAMRPAPDEPDGVGARLAQLERAFGEQSARLRRIEERLGLLTKAHAAPASPSQGAATVAGDPVARGNQVAPVVTTPPPPPSPPSPPPSPANGTRTTDAAASVSPHDDAGRERDSSAAREKWAVNVPTAGAGDERARPDDSSARPLPPRTHRIEADDDEGPFVSGKAGAAQASKAVHVEPVARVRRDLETAIGGSWFNWIGIIALTLGVAFFLKYAFENQWIGPTGRVLLGGAAGCALLGLAERLRLRGYRPYAHVLSGGGILILYLSVYAAYNFYHLIGQPFAFLLMAAVTSTAVLLAARYDALPIAVLGLLGGFATPVLLSRGVDNQIALFGYIALLDAGVLALAYFKEWRSLNYLSFAATVLMFAGWMDQWYEPAKLGPTIFFLTLFFLMFAALAVLHNLLKQRPARWFDVSLALTNATIYFATSYSLLELTHHSVLGAHALAVAALFGLLFLTAERLHHADQLLALSYLGAAVTFLTIAVAIQLDQHWATIGWAVEGLMLTWVGFRTGRAAPRYAALPVLGVAVTHWFSTDLAEFLASGGAWPLLNAHAVSCYALIATLGASLWLYQRRGEAVDQDEREIISAVFTLAIFSLGLTLLTVDVNDYLGQRRRDLFAQTSDSSRRSAFWESQVFTNSVLWLIYASIALALGVVRRILVLRVAALLLLACAILAGVLNSLFHYSAPWHLPVFNLTFITCALIVAALAAGTYFYARAGEGISWYEREIITPILVVTANFFAVLGLSLEVMGGFNRAKALAWALPDGWTEAARVEEWKQFLLSFVWSLYATVALYCGLVRGRRQPALRFFALLLLAVACLKLLWLDVWQYSAAWHWTLVNQTFATFAVVVTALVACLALYRWAGAAVGEKERATVEPLLLGLANALALVGLSVEVMGPFNRQKALAWGQPEGWRAAAAVENWKQMWLTWLWTAYGTAALYVGLRRGRDYVRYAALGLLAVAGVKLLLVDATYYNAVWHWVPLLNQTFAAFALYVLALVVVMWLYARAEFVNPEEREIAINIITIAGNALAITALSLEAAGHFEKLMRLGTEVAAERRDLRLARQLSLSVIWAVYGGALLVVGLLRRNQLLRVMALLLLSLTILKVFFWDLASLDKIYRIVSFIVLGAILLVVSFLYQQRQQRAARAEQG